MMRFEKNIDDRKVLVARLSALTGLEAHYTRIPRCAFEIGPFTVEKDGKLTVEEGADNGILETLVSEGLIGACVEKTETAAQEAVAQNMPTMTENGPITTQNVSTIGEILSPDLGTEDWEDDGGEVAPAYEGVADYDVAADFEAATNYETVADYNDATVYEEEQEIWRPETDIFAQETEITLTTEDTTEDTTEETTQTTEATELTEATEETAQEPDGTVDERETEDTADDVLIPDEEEPQEAQEAQETETDAQNFPLNAQISFPLSRHTVASLTNLICMIHTRGPLLSKATRGTFHVDKDLVDDILDRYTFTRPAELISFVQGWRGSKKPLVGISFDEEKVIFDGFTKVKDQEHLETFMKLAAAMNKMAQTQKRVQAKEKDDSNEKYSLRTWLLRLGMNGLDYKAERKILLENLSGHAAFRTKADEEKWKTRQQAKKLALQAAKKAEVSEG